MKEIEELYERLTFKQQELFKRIYQSVNNEKVKNNKIHVLSLLKRTIEKNIENGIQIDIDRKLKLKKLNILN